MSLTAENPWANYVPAIIPPFADRPETPRFTDTELASMEKWAGHCPGCDEADDSDEDEIN